MITGPQERLGLTGQQRRVAVATSVGTAVEWYDYFVYANAAALVFGPLFFAPLHGALATIASFATVGISFVFRPLGAIAMGVVGDRFGRRAVLVTTLLFMGACTTLIGLLPTYAGIGFWAPVLLILLRVGQGFSAGGEWGGAALMAVEHAPRNRRGRLGAFPQLGVAAGMLLASGVVSIVSVATTDDQFTHWGWRIPFLLSIILIAVGHYVRRRVDETPVFNELKGANRTEKTPLKTLFGKHPKLVIQATAVFLGNNAAGYMLAGGFILKYASNDLNMDASEVLAAITLGSLAWMATTWLAAKWSDRIGRRRMYIVGWVSMLAWIFPFFAMIDSADIWIVGVALIGFGAVEGLSTGQMPAFYAEHFPSSIRLSGSSISHALGSVLGGAFAPMVAAALIARYNTTVAVGVYIFSLVLISLVATLSIRDRTGSNLGSTGESDSGEELGEQAPGVIAAR